MLNPAQTQLTDRPSSWCFTSERLFVVGLRCVLNGHDEEHFFQWRDVWVGYSQCFGRSNATPLLRALWDFAEAYRRFAAMPTGYHQVDCPCMARDEFLSLALLSSIQHFDQTCALTCMRIMARKPGDLTLETPACQLATEFYYLGERFRHISKDDVETMLIKSAAVEDSKQAVLH